MSLTTRHLAPGLTALARGSHTVFWWKGNVTHPKDYAKRQAIIVGTTREPGEITLTATAKGLAPTTLTLQSQPCLPRPSVPDLPENLVPALSH